MKGPRSPSPAASCQDMAPPVGMPHAPQPRAGHSHVHSTSQAWAQNTHTHAPDASTASRQHRRLGRGAGKGGSQAVVGWGLCWRARRQAGACPTSIQTGIKGSPPLPHSSPRVPSLPQGSLSSPRTSPAISPPFAPGLPPTLPPHQRSPTPGLYTACSTRAESGSLDGH